jgi:hypothetical protein
MYNWDDEYAKYIVTNFDTQRMYILTIFYIQVKSQHAAEQCLVCVLQMSKNAIGCINHHFHTCNHYHIHTRMEHAANT